VDLVPSVVADAVVLVVTGFETVVTLITTMVIMIIIVPTTTTVKMIRLTNNFNAFRLILS